MVTKLRIGGKNVNKLIFKVFSFLHFQQKLTGILIFILTLVNYFIIV